MTKKQKKGLPRYVIALMLMISLVTGIAYFFSIQTSERDVKLKDYPNFPRYVYNSNKSLLAYRIAITIPEVLKAVPCTCGCTMIGHTSSKDCFINDDGSYSPHAANCDICQDIAIDAFNLYKQGYSITKIQNVLHIKYETNNP